MIQSYSGQHSRQLVENLSFINEIVLLFRLSIIFSISEVG